MIVTTPGEELFFFERWQVFETRVFKETNIIFHKVLEVYKGLCCMFWPQRAIGRTDTNLLLDFLAGKKQIPHSKVSGLPSHTSSLLSFWVPHSSLPAAIENKLPFGLKMLVLYLWTPSQDKNEHFQYKKYSRIKFAESPLGCTMPFSSLLPLQVYTWERN